MAVNVSRATLELRPYIGTLQDNRRKLVQFGFGFKDQIDAQSHLC